MTVWKWEFAVQDRFTLRLPKDAEVLTVQAQRDRACLWALCDPEAEKEDRTFACWGTGHQHFLNGRSPGRYVGTFQLMSGALVFHLFEEELT